MALSARSAIAVIVKRDGSQITMKEAREWLGFEVIEVYRDWFYFNSARVEAELQRSFKEWGGMELGEHLWRVSGAGGFGLYKKWDADKTKFGTRVVKVFIAYCKNLPAMIASGEVQVVA